MAKASMSLGRVTRRIEESPRARQLLHILHYSLKPHASQQGVYRGRGDDEARQYTQLVLGRPAAAVRSRPKDACLQILDAVARRFRQAL